jgi:hypothetical protein
VPKLKLERVAVALSKSVPVDDVWMRDIAPVFAKRGGDAVAIDLTFNGWDCSRNARRACVHTPRCPITSFMAWSRCGSAVPRAARRNSSPLIRCRAGVGSHHEALRLRRRRDYTEPLRDMKGRHA